MYRALIIGCGRIAGGGVSLGKDTHAGAINSQDRMQLVGGVDSNLEKSKRFASLYGCKSYSMLEDALIDSKPDLVTICSPDHTHFELAKRTLLSNSPPKILFVEKPVCKTELEYKELLGLSVTKNVKVFVNHSRRFNPKYQKLREIICSGSLGSLIRVNATYYSGWFHNGTHIIDTILFLLDDKITWICINNSFPSPYEDDPSLELTGYLKKSHANLVISAISEDFYQLFDFDFWFKNGRLRIEDFGNSIFLETPRINTIGESVLKKTELDLPEIQNTELEIAIGLMCDYLDNKNSECLNLMTLSNTKLTVKTLSDGYNLFMGTRGINENKFRAT